MPKEFTAGEIFEMAVQMERNGARFYREASKQLKSPAARQLVEDLAEMEDTHEKVFIALKAELSDSARLDWSYDPDDRAVKYLQAMVEGKVFPPQADSGEQLSGREGVEEIFSLAIGKEKDSIVFYLGLKELVPERQGKDKIDEIIQEEMSHITLLSQGITVLGNERNRR